MDDSKHSAYLDYEWATVLNRACLKLLGVWPDGDDTKRKKLITDFYAIFLLITITCSCTIPTVHSLIRIWDDFLSMIDNLQYLVPLLMSMLKFFILWRKKNNLIPILKMIRKDWLKPKTEDDRHVMIRRARIARIITMCGYLITFLSFVGGVIMPLFGFPLRYITNITDPGKPMIMQSYFIYDITKSPSYEITLVLQIVSTVIVGCMYSSTDNFMGLLVFHICGQFENLNARLSRIDLHEFENAISYSVQDHRRLIRSVKIIDDAFNIMLIGVVLLFGLQFAVYSFFFIRVIKHGSDISYSYFRVIFMLIAFITLSAHTCFYCIAGEILVIECDRFYEVTCKFKWYSLPPRQARNLMMIMIHARKPLYITAGKIFPMTMSTFCNLLKTSGSYISFLMAHNE